MLYPLLGTPLVVHTLRRAREAGCFDEILCLTDSTDIRDAVEAAGFRAVLSGPAANGTDRIGKHAHLIRNDLIVNLQGDEPAFAPAALRLLARALAAEPAKVHILVEDRVIDPADLADPNRCKAGLDETGHVADFYRASPRVPVRDSRLQFGAYAYSKDFLRRYADRAPSLPEISLSHEMLRDLALAPIRAHGCPWPGQSVDVPRDAELASALLERGFASDSAASPSTT